jgi:hypothetical protein
MSRDSHYEGKLNPAGERHGDGLLEYSNGDKYNGAWQNDLKCGKGVFHSANGEVYEGM